VVQLQLTLAQEPDGSLNILDLLSSVQLPLPLRRSLFALEVENLYIRDGELTCSSLPFQVSRARASTVHLSAQQDKEKLRFGCSS